MSILRILGVVLAFLTFLMLSMRLRRHSENRFDVAVLAIFGLGILLVSLFPGFVNLPAEILSLDKHERGRLLTLLIISSVVLWLLHIYERGKTEHLILRFDHLVRKLAVEDFFNRKPSIDKGVILVIIPSYNEAKNLVQIIPRLPEKVLGKPVVPLVVDDGSTDDTASICLSFQTPGVRNIINRGGGAALRVGFDIAQDLHADVIVTMDGDGQHRPEDIETLVIPILTSQADLVVGSRLLGEMEQYSRLRYCGVVFFGKIISALLGQKVTDPASGFRAFHPKLLEVCKFTQDQYHTAELIIEAAKHGLRIAEKPITIRKRLSGKSKKGKEYKYALYFLKTIVKSWIR